MRRVTPFLLLLLPACAASVESPDAAALIDVPAWRSVGPLATDFDVEHYALELAVHPQQRRIEGVCRVRLFPLVDKLRTVNLDLVGLEASAVTDRAGRALDFAHFGGRLRIELTEPAPRGRAVELAIAYGGSPRKGLWFAGGDPPDHVFTQGECEDARWWFPCQDAPSDRATSELVLDLPAGWTSVAAGERIEARDVGGRRRERWRMHVPHPPYLETLVAGELVTVAAEWEGVPLSYHAPPGFGERLESCLEATDDALAFLSRVSGRRYPYPKYATACVENFPFGGMENVSATTLTVGALRDERGRADQSADGLVLHEAAHQWFGDLLTCRDWSEVWLNEGFATYLTQLWYEETAGQEDFQLRMDDTIEAYLHGHDAHPRAIVHRRCRDPIDLFFSGHAYAGGATRLHLLRHVLGDEAFFAGLRRYVGENAGRSVTTADLRAAMERASGQDLERFFQQWLHTPGHPELEVIWAHDAERGRVLLTINQVHEVRPGVPEVFEAPLEVELGFAAGPRRQRLSLTARRELFELAAEEAPRWVLVDPDRWLPARVRARRSAEEWMAMAEGAGPVERRSAVRALASVARAAQGEERTARVQALVARLEGDGRREVRSAAARSLGRVGGEQARSALIRAARTDAAPQVRVAALETLTAVGADPELAALGRALVLAPQSWAVCGAAASLVASADPTAAGTWLREQLSSSEPSPLGEPHRRLLPALVDAAGPGAAALLRVYALAGGAPEPLRIEAAQQLGRTAAGQAESIATLADLLGSDLGRLRGAAVEALIATRDPGARRVLAAYYSGSVSPRERRAIEGAFGL